MYKWIITLLAATAVIRHVDAINGGHSAKYRMMANVGLNPDGSPAAKASSNSTENIRPEFVRIPLNHFADGTASGELYSNRFWVAESGYKPGGPVFLFDVGESEAASSVQSQLQDPTSFFKQIVDQFGGIGIVWEHRFYGSSTPFNITTSTPATHFKYLTIEQALADVVFFASQFSRPSMPDVDLTPTGTPWVFLGASYSGTRAAFMRNFYPKTITASYASSAPVQASIDMSFYFEPVWQGMNHYGFGNCTKDIQAATQAMDMIMEDSTAAADLKETFFGPEARNNSNAGMADALASLFPQFQSFGVEGGSESLRSFCEWMETDPKTNATAPSEGFAPSKGVNYTINRWSSWPFMVSTVNDNLETNCKGTDNTTATSCLFESIATDADSIAWAWQHCTQWGFLPYANLGPHQLISKYNDLQHQLDICQRQFPDGKASGLLPLVPQADKTNAFFGGWTIRPSNTFWSGGEFDPWRTLSPLSDEWFAPNVTEEQAIPSCGAATSEDKIFSYTMPDAEHGFDLGRGTTFPADAPSREFFTDALSQWLECWKKGVQPEDPASILRHGGSGFALQRNVTVRA
ncbi:hypothetical protein NA57DRAFT_61226 [Rhizodiscina lignyota]|uniref:Uncharacterized protein n=1 Tax=Rhizodiscina lignyota TaxID=1504668 RepID=A0A9P4I553_9PEZI|nr:hypothetical protein NA57DRAFT_61226 [Rhizodiscina lignyota]